MHPSMMTLLLLPAPTSATTATVTKKVKRKVISEDQRQMQLQLHQLTTLRLQILLPQARKKTPKSKIRKLQPKYQTKNRNPTKRKKTPPVPNNHRPNQATTTTTTKHQTRRSPTTPAIQLNQLPTRRQPILQLQQQRTKRRRNPKRTRQEAVPVKRDGVDPVPPPQLRKTVTAKVRATRAEAVRMHLNQRRRDLGQVSSLGRAVGPNHPLLQLQQPRLLHR
mmetsp:Transcript_20114/g.25396  ORF Transcript_20114/g.25396 Transcript_20114/m.25396 type:complete len:221 (+) Transcript_20114:211-873(+)